MPDPIALLVGLGNPGEKYARTRHNVGFMAIDHLAQEFQITLAPTRRFHGEFGEKSKLYLLKPSTYMNLSGQAVGAVVHWYKLTPASVLVIYDDLDLPLGKIRIRKTGSAGGHNGMKSIITHLGTQDFPRLRIGIGRGNKEVSDYVLGKFSAEEMAVLPAVFQLMGKAIVMMEKEGIDKAMSLYNSQTAILSS